MMRQTVCLVQWCDPSGATVSLPLFSQLVTHWVDGRACGHHSWITAALPTLRQGMPFSHTPTRGQHKKSGTAKGQVKLFVALQQAVERFVAPAFRRIFRASLTKRNSRPIKGAEACLQFLSFLFVSFRQHIQVTNFPDNSCNESQCSWFHSTVRKAAAGFEPSQESAYYHTLI